MNLKELFVPYELALKLKEKGFEDRCLGFFNLKYADKSEVLIQDTSELNKASNLINAPTYDQVFSWFLEKYQLFGTVSGSIVGNYFEGIVYIKGENALKYIQQAKLTRIYSTYKEAQIACINKLIEIIS